MPGGPVSVDDIAAPGPLGPDDVLLAMRRAPINPADLLQIAGRYAFPSTLPQQLGAEGVGEVMGVGAEVEGLMLGDLVLPLSRGNWTTHRLLNQRDLIRLPDGLPIDSAAMLRINPATAWRLLHQQEARPGEWIIQNGATSMVARWVRRLAADKHRPVLNVVRRTGSLPTEMPMAEDGDGLVATVERITGGGHVTLALDCVAGSASGRLAQSLSPDGTMLVYGHLSGKPCVIPSPLLTGRGLTVRGFSLRPSEARDDVATLHGLYNRLAAIAAEPAMAPHVATTYPLDALPEALAHAARPGLGGRVMLALDA